MGFFQAGLEAAGGGACGDSQGGPGCVSPFVAPPLGSQHMGWRGVQSASRLGLEPEPSWS